MTHPAEHDRTQTGLATVDPAGGVEPQLPRSCGRCVTSGADVASTRRERSEVALPRGRPPTTASVDRTPGRLVAQRIAAPRDA
jgi:hypothetical protein